MPSKKAKAKQPKNTPAPEAAKPTTPKRLVGMVHLSHGGFLSMSVGPVCWTIAGHNSDMTLRSAISLTHEAAEVLLAALLTHRDSSRPIQNFRLQEVE